MSSPPDEKRRRRLTEDEHRLWSGITRSIRPLKRRRPQPANPAHDTVAMRAERPRVPARPRAEAPPVRQHPAPKPPPSLAALDRRQKQRLARGTEPLDGRIDLHGRSQSEAHTMLLAFLRRAQADEARFVLVITGKGGAAAGRLAGERGILRRQVPLWLRLPDFRPYVLAAEAAHPAHGGEGALYVRLRRAAR